MTVKLVMTEEKIKAGTKRLIAELELAGVCVDALGYNKALHVFSKALFDKPYEEIKATCFDKLEVDGKEHHSVYIFGCGSNDILVVDGIYYGATNPGTDMEIPYHALDAMAESRASSLGVRVYKVTLPSILNSEPESDDEWVDLADEMGYFMPWGR
jgi:hypothetical protein